MRCLTWLVLAGCLWLPLAAMGQSEPVRLAMRVAASVTVNPDGGIARYQVERATALPVGVQKLLGEVIPGWHFPGVATAGLKAPLPTRMSIWLDGTVTGSHDALVDGHRQQQHTVQVGVRTIDLACPPPHADLTFARGCDPAGAVRHWPTDQPPALPAYPEVARAAQAGGAVHLYLDIDSMGRVMQAAVHAVDLYQISLHPRAIRKALANAALAAAQDWQFSVPVEGPALLAGHWVVAQSVRFVLADSDAAHVADGEWLAYNPGPVTPVEWAGAGDDAPVRMPDLTVTATALPSARGRSRR